MMNPKYPVYVPTKGRWKLRHTIKMLESMSVPYKAVVEPQEFDDYASVIDEGNILVTPHQNRGLVVTRNWIWDHAQKIGAKRFWTFDDNIRAIYRLNKNVKARVKTGAALCVIEDFVERYKNVLIAGMNYEMFVPRKKKKPPFTLNTRIYSNMLIETNIPYRNEGFYNDDTDLCLRVLKDGWCTMLFNAFLIDKINTMVVKGGMTPHYQDDGRYKMALELQRKHPDVTEIVHKWGRWQHKVDYSRFQNNELIRNNNALLSEGVNEYGMVLHINCKTP